MTSVQTGALPPFDAVSAPTTELVTVTITESGYDIPPAPQTTRPPTPWVPEIIARALAHRRQAGSAPPIIASLDNLLGNGTILRQRVLEMAERLDPTLPSWIAGGGQLPELGRRSHGAGAHRRRHRGCRGATGPSRPRHGDRRTIPILDTRRGRRTAAVRRCRRPGRDGRDAVRAPEAVVAERPTFRLRLLRAAGRVRHDRDRRYGTRRSVLCAEDDRRHAGGRAVSRHSSTPPASREEALQPVRQSEPRSYLPAGGRRRVAQAATATPPHHRRPPGRKASTPRDSPPSWPCGSLPSAAWRSTGRCCRRWWTPRQRGSAASRRRR